MEWMRERQGKVLEGDRPNHLAPTPRDSQTYRSDVSRVVCTAVSEIISIRAIPGETTREDKTAL